MGLGNTIFAHLFKARLDYVKATIRNNCHALESKWLTFQDRDAVMEGIWKNENIMIHVGQNLFNYVFSTLAWFTASQIYSAAGRARGFTAEGRALTMDEAADQVLAAIRKFEEQKRR